MTCVSFLLYWYWELPVHILGFFVLPQTKSGLSNIYWRKDKTITYTLRLERIFNIIWVYLLTVEDNLTVISEWEGGLTRVVILHILKVIYMFSKMFLSITSLVHNNSNVGPGRCYFPHFTEGGTKAQRVALNLPLTHCVEALFSSLSFPCYHTYHLLS